ncbi:D-alanyl-D-alanine carboxypeptidase family protein [Intestinimonas butyriciproducens]|nr:D-alanyl-D-alanine carboxypeptidase family protein [Intestinimonas butyriciproducens]
MFRYPGDKQSLTGVAEEVWHYRYVGKKAAEFVHSRGLCLEEYAKEQT